MGAIDNFSIIPGHDGTRPDSVRVVLPGLLYHGIPNPGNYLMLMQTDTVLEVERLSKLYSRAQGATRQRLARHLWSSAVRMAFKTF